MLQPPVSTPTARSTAMPTSRMCWYSRSVSVIAGATVIESPVCTPIGSRFSIEQTTTTLSCRSRISSSSNSFQPTHRLLDQDLVHRAGRQAAGDHRSHLSAVGGQARAEAAHRERRPDDDPVADGGGEVERLVQRVADREAGTSAADAAHDLLEPLPVLAALDRLDVGADQLDAVLLQHAALVQCRPRGSARSARPGSAAARRSGVPRGSGCDAPARRTRGSAARRRWRRRTRGRS